MTKDKIIERLIEDKHITAEEAVILLKETTYPGTFTPAAPYKPISDKVPYHTICGCTMCNCTMANRMVDVNPNSNFNGTYNN